MELFLTFLFIEKYFMTFFDTKNKKKLIFFGCSV